MKRVVQPPACGRARVCVFFVLAFSVACSSLCGVAAFQNCDKGKWGQNCAFNCPHTCSEAGCDPDTGYCYQDGCDPGWWGIERCNHPCNQTCHANVCEQLDGTCDGCNAGHWGYFCEKTCPSHCGDSGRCDQYGGQCACSDGFWGTACDKACSGAGCKNCDAGSGDCLSCPSGYWGAVCGACPTHCSGGLCRQNGTCPHCTGGMCGDTCSEACDGSDLSVVYTIVLVVIVLAVGVAIGYSIFQWRARTRGPRGLDPRISIPGPSLYQPLADGEGPGRGGPQIQRISIP
eukprot:gnl/Hemi2/18328_TR6069_c0_g1_i1.p2 gnl/Hemi2/18328_TR6069_c0_g1~~gnl/Hemi2/18328_TR6069_c0_g1_i1.p2  ORF type:complete len:288 (+),score=78.18 gnl/Hemi2/18328_TR6069_c0_g1_i1:56-919(+)